jgi:DNA-binding XRE family transcriptional regulator
MREHTRKHHTERSEYSSEKNHNDTPMSADEMIKKICGDLPDWAVALKGLRYREGLTQTALGNLLNIEQTNISQMERGKRPIGKMLAKRLAKIFKTDYRLFL